MKPEHYTPRMNFAAGTPTKDWELVAERCYEQGCELERENAKLRSALLRTTGSLGLIIGGAGAHGVGHKENYDAAKLVLDETFHDET